MSTDAEIKSEEGEIKCEKTFFAQDAEKIDFALSSVSDTFKSEENDNSEAKFACSSELGNFEFVSK